MGTARRIKAFLKNSASNLIQNGQRNPRMRMKVMRAEPQASLSGGLLRFKGEYILRSNKDRLFRSNEQ